jgi:hypothetical protein
VNTHKIIFRVHAVERMFERRVSARNLAQALSSGETIEDYSAEMPEPGRLILGFQGQRPFHVVISENPETSETTIITVYIPDPRRWTKDFKRRK